MCYATEFRKLDLCDRCWLACRVDETKARCSVGRLEEWEWELRDALHALKSHRHELPRR
eukprot:COSAG01_NODE_11715_length_1874_cov_1.406761_3_plen_59_part_00